MSRSAKLVAVLVAILLTAGWYLLLVKPILTQVTEAEVEVEVVVDDEFRLKSQRAALQKIEDNMLAYFAAIGEIESSVPPSPQTASLIDDLAVLADDTGVLWESGSYGNPAVVEGTDYLEIPVNILISGQFFEVLGYLYGIADMDRLIRVESVTITPVEDDSGFTILSVAITARAFTTGDIIGTPVPEDEDETPEEVTPEGDEGAEDAEALAGAS